MTGQELPGELLWEGEHASDLALSVYADGEESLLPRDVVDHLGSCASCAMRLGETALITRGVTHALRSLDPPLATGAVAPSGARKPASQPVPWGAVFGALGLAALGLVPRLEELPHGFAAFAVRLAHAAPIVLQGAVRIVRAGLGPGFLLVTIPCAALLIAGGFAVTRLLHPLVQTARRSERFSRRNAMKLVTGNVLVVVILVTSFAATALAAVRHAGSWPATEAPVSVDATNVPQDDAIKRLADAAGWSVVFKDQGESPAPGVVSLHVTNQPPPKVLDMILSKGDYVARRDGTIVSIERVGDSDDDDADESTPPVPPVPPVPPHFGSHHGHGRHHHGADRTVTGGHLTIDKGESVGDVSVFGGSVDVLGDVQGDLGVFGGSAHVHDGGEVHGDAVTLGGSLEIDDGAKVDGDVTRIGGSFGKRGKARVGGKVRDGDQGLRISLSDGDDDDDDAATKLAASKSHEHTFLTRVGDRLTSSSILFAFGAVLLALATKRMDAIKVEVASRPMRNFALGIVGGLLGIVALVALCVTVVGIPLAIIGVLGAVFAVYGSVTAVLTTAGQAILGHKTSNPYVHLAAGCLILFVGGSVPVVGGLLIAAVVLIAIGALVATRGAGLVPPRVLPTPNDPYRSAAL